MNEPTVIACTPDAYAAYETYRHDLEPRLHPETGDLAVIGDWAGKLPGALVRIAGLLHLAEHPRQAGSVLVSEDTMNRALSLGPYFIGHARAAFGLMDADAGVAGARRILTWITEKKKTVFCVREAHNAMQGAFPRADDLKAPLGLLVQHHYLRQAPHPKRGRQGGRPRSPRYTVSPVWRRDGSVGSVPMYGGLEDKSETTFGGRENERVSNNTYIHNLQNPPHIVITSEQGVESSNTDAQPVNTGPAVRL